MSTIVMDKVGNTLEIVIPTEVEITENSMVFRSTQNTNKIILTVTNVGSIIHDERLVFATSLEEKNYTKKKQVDKTTGVVEQTDKPTS